MARSFRLNERALADLIDGPGGRRVLTAAAEQVRDEARMNAAHISEKRAKAISNAPPERDASGTYVDVGYLRDHPGFVLWWHEVGSSQIPADPHLRPALKPGLF